MDNFVVRIRQDSPSTSRSRSPCVRQPEPDVSFIDEAEGGNQPEVLTKGARKKMSAVWRYFKKSGDRKIAKCNTCGKEYRTSGNTSNLADHLKRYHPLLGNKQDDDSSSSARSSLRSVSPYFKKSLQYEEFSQRKKQLDRALIEMICADFQPFTIVNDKGFKKFVNLLDPKYVLPSTFTVANKLLKDVYLETYGKLKEILSLTDHVAITCDSWTSVTTDSYLTVTCHFIYNFELKCAVLSTKPLENGIHHTAENIANTLRDIFYEWEIHNKITCIVTDNASNMVKACDILQKRHLPCYAHTINLVVQDNLSYVDEIINKVKRIVNFFKSSCVAMETQRSEQNTDRTLKLIQSCPTRWNSIFYMVQRVLQVNEALGRALLKLRKAPMPLTVDDIAILKDVECILKCFQEATKKVSGISYVTISLVIPVSYGIYNYLNSLNELSTEEGKTLCKRVIESVKNRLFPYETRTVTKLSTLMDPRFKKEGFRMSENAAHAATLLEQEMHRFISQPSEQTESSSVIPSSTSGPSLFSFVKDRLYEKSRSVTKDVIIIKRQYLERDNAEETVDPLIFWKVMGRELTGIDQCVIKYLCVPATSTESERNFSSAGLVVSDRRSRLKPNNVNMITFLHKNINSF